MTILYTYHTHRTYLSKKKKRTYILSKIETFSRLCSLEFKCIIIVLTKCCRIEGCVVVHEAAVACDNCLIDTISDHHQVPLVLGNVHILFIHTSRDIDQEVPSSQGRIVWSCRNNIIDGGEVSTSILTHSHDVRHRNHLINTL